MTDDAADKPTVRIATQSWGSGGTRWKPPSPQEVALMLPQYDQWEMLGCGGMGAVYKARQIALERTVAVKLLPPDADTDDNGETQFIERFKNEARAMAKLMHPAIVAVFDFGHTSDGQLYFAMEFVDGTDVSKLIQSQGRLPPEQAIAITAHVCDGLQYAHERGIIHRDIKPANVLINLEGDVKVADFGLAKMEDPALGMGLTKSTQTMGTPDYVAPEALILGVVVDHRADLYSLGVMLYLMLTGKIPRGMAQPPSVVVPGLDPRFDTIVQRAMHEDREARFQSALEIRYALDEICNTPAQTAEEPEAAPVEAAVPRKRAGMMALAVGSLVALLAVGGFFLWQKQQKKPTSSAGTAANIPASSSAPTANSPTPYPQPKA